MSRKWLGAAGMAALALMGGIVAGPASADDPWSPRDHNDSGKSTQQNKNLMRNVGIGLGAAAAYEALNGKKTEAVVLGAGAVLAGAQYEKDRKAQNQDNDWRRDGYRDDYHGDRDRDRVSYRDRDAYRDRQHGDRDDRSR